MALTAGWIIERVARELHDEAHTRWPEAEKLHFLNLAQLQIAMVRPDACAAYKTMTLAASARQLLPGVDIRLLTVTRNMGTDGTTPGRHISLTDRATMDAQLAAWTAGQAVTEIESYVLDDRVSNEFFIYPPPNTANLQIEYVAVVRPTDCATTAATISVPDIYVSPIMHWMMYRCLSFQMDSPASAQQAISHYQLFHTELGVEMQAGNLVSPNYQENYIPAQVNK